MGSDFWPDGSHQVGFGAVACLLGAIVVALLFGELTVLVAELNRKAAKQAGKVS